MEISFDETEMPLLLQGTAKATKTHVVVIHCRLTVRRGSSTESLEVVVPSAVVESTRAPCLLEALRARMPFSITEAATKRNRELVLVLCTDSGSSCLKLARHLGAVPAVCRMHQHCLSLTAPMKLGGMMSPLFCGSLLMKRQRVQSLVHRQLRSYLQNFLHIEYDPPTAEEKNHIQSVLELLSPLLTCRLVERQRVTARTKALDRLKVFLSGSLRGDHLFHWCPYGCHNNLEAAQEELLELLLECFFRHPPPVPAWNKWNKTWPALQWFAVIMQLAKVMPASLSGLCDLVPESALEIGEDDIIGLDDNQTYERQDHARFRKTNKWVNHARTADKLLAICLSIQFSLDIMGSFFHASTRFGNAGLRSIGRLVNPMESPAVRCLHKYFAVLADEAHSFWLPLVGGGRGWSPVEYHLASVPMLLEVGSLFKRFVVAVNAWPWRLALLVADGVSHEEKRRVARLLMDAADCCLDDLSARIKACCCTVEAVLSQATLQFLHDVFTNTPLTNVGSESRFASAQTRWSSSHGHPGTPATLASDHVLSESKLVLDSVTECGP